MAETKSRVETGKHIWCPTIFLRSNYRKASCPIMKRRNNKFRIKRKPTVRHSLMKSWVSEAFKKGMQKPTWGSMTFKDTVIWDHPDVSVEKAVEAWVHATDPDKGGRERTTWHVLPHPHHNFNLKKLVQWFFFFMVSWKIVDFSISEKEIRSLQSTERR